MEAPIILIEFQLVFHNYCSKAAQQNLSEARKRYKERKSKEVGYNWVAERHGDAV